jgi:alpha-galactosidase
MQIKFKLSHVFTLLILCSLPFFSLQNAIGQTITIPIETQHNALVLQAGKDKDLKVIYFGKKLANATEYKNIAGSSMQSEDYSGILNSAYTPSGSRNLVEPAISVTHADGNNSLDLKYVKHEVKTISDGVSLLSIVLKDPVYNFEVTLYYKSFFAEDVMEQWSVIKHAEKGNVVLQKFASANLHLKAEATG